jgi:recombination protein RecA
VQATVLHLAERADQADPSPILIWGAGAISRRLVELSGAAACASLTITFQLVLEAQRAAEPVAWVTSRDSSFFPPDAAAAGIDLDQLAVVRILRAPDLPRAADKLVRSGAFGLVVLDLHDQAPASIAMPLLSRLVGLCQKHDTALVCLTPTSESAPSLGSLVSLRGEATHVRRPDGLFDCTVRALKDKRVGPGWTHTEVCRGPAGLR